jgi:hypothetical protein
MKKNMSTGRNVDFTTRTSTICIRQPSTAGGILQSREREHKFIPSFCLVYFLDAYYIIFYAIALSFLFSSPPQFFRPRRPLSLPSG